MGMEGAALSAKTGDARTAGTSPASAEDHSEPIESRARGLPKSSPAISPVSLLTKQYPLPARRTFRATSRSGHV
ncbi:hypothetical protein DV707_00560 [Halobellus limi]|uniref:Uncharacterized protein n=1 Tax=Halobellus limi TaxID=699433 RepID=A0A4D6GZT8_9EURY|nr:hypothetical protein DV707_00560 [Halobellus limi]